MHLFLLLTALVASAHCSSMPVFHFLCSLGIHCTVLEIVWFSSNSYRHLLRVKRQSSWSMCLQCTVQSSRGKISAHAVRLKMARQLLLSGLAVGILSQAQGKVCLLATMLTMQKLCYAVYQNISKKKKKKRRQTHKQLWRDSVASPFCKDNRR